MSRVEPNRNIYVGHRYVPKVFGEWDKQNEYEGLSIVTYQGASYTSKKRVPVGIDILNDEFWVITGNYNAQVEYYRQDVERVQNEMVDLDDRLTDNLNDTRQYVDDETASTRQYVNDETASTRQYVDDETASTRQYVDDETASIRQYVDDETTSNRQYIDDEIDKKDEQLEQIALNVKTFGAVGDGVTDDTQAILNTIQKLKQLGGGKVIFPKGTYLISESLPLVSNSVYYSDGAIIKDHANLGASPIFENEGSYKENITIDGFTFTNGSATTGAFTIGKDVLRTKNVHGLEIKNCFFTEVEGGYCIFVSHSSNVTIQHNKFYRWTYAGVFLGAECDTVVVSDNILDTPTTTVSSSNAYCICTGSDTLNAGEYLVKNVWIQRNKILNNPKWEAIDSHGGENIWITDNYIYNCYVGIMTGLASSVYTTEESIKNVFIKNNVMENDSISGSYGIILLGRGVDNLATGEITGNYIKNFGSMTANTLSPIVVSQSENVIIKDNKIESFGMSGITANFETYDILIEDNVIEKSLVTSGGTTNAGINTAANWIWGLTIKNNKVVDCRDVVAFNGTSNRVGGVRMEGNFGNRVTNVYNRTNGTPINQNTIPEETASHQYLIMKYGDKIINDTGVETHVVSSPVSGMGATYTGQVGNVTGTPGSKNLSFTTIISPWTYRDFPKGMNVIIKGAGNSGNDLTAEVVSYTQTTLTISETIATHVNSAEISYAPLVLSEI